ncbi:MAG: Ig-like domain-containing protein [Oscillospiraceae bacterium]|nr:Ig-like domain-containing protein [Oscillospiraceae bacterium]
MNKVICDVCGTDYPESSAQCPICGSANAGTGQTSAGNTVGEELQHTPTKGGHFSKANVRKRVKASGNQQQVAPLQVPVREEYDSTEEEPGFDEEELEGVSNKGLILIVVLLLIAIIAVSTYIAVTFFGGKKADDATGTTGSSYQSSTAPTDPSDPDSSDPEGSAPGTTEPGTTDPSEERPSNPCTDLTLGVSEIILESNAPMQITYTVLPADTTDTVSFWSDKPEVAYVDALGRVYGVSRGTANITVTCGEKSVVIPVRSLVEGTEIPTNPTDPTNPSGPSDPGTSTVPSTGVKLELNRVDFSLFFVGDKWNVYSGSINKSDITWTSDNEAVATVENGLVVAAGPGSTTIRAEYQGQKASCKVYCQFTVEEPTDPTEPSAPTEPSDPSSEATEPSGDASEPSTDVTDPTTGVTDPSTDATDPSTDATDSSQEVTEPSSEPVLEHKLLVNGISPAYRYQGKENSADISLDWRGGNSPEYCRLTITNAENVVWTSNDEAVCVVEATDASNCRVVAKGTGRALLTATVDGVEFIVAIHIRNM